MNASAEHEPAPLGDVERALDLAGRGGERLLAQHVLAGLERADRPLDVQPVGQRDVDGVDVGVGEQRLVGAVRARDAVLVARTPARAPRRGWPTATTSTASGAARARERARR